ncbi:MAG: methyltransferase domain-containing protein, partial [Candidatus Deferrimicrobiaceae bacterium]
MGKPEQSFSWSEFYSYRKKIRKDYPSVFGLTIKKKTLDVVTEELKNGDKILDVGASNRSLGEKIRERLPSVVYKSMDIDKAQDHDYYSLDEISESFDMIILVEVIEHLEFQNGISMLFKLLSLLNSRGKLILSTPNIFHPNRYWEDSDHKTPYCYDGIS